MKDGPDTTWTATGQAWSDKPADKILADIMDAKKKMERMRLAMTGVTVFAGEAAYAMIRQRIPEDTELVQVKTSTFLEENECYVVKNELLHGRWLE